MEIISRAAWGAQHDDGGGNAPVPYEGIYLHHTVTIAPDLLPPFDDDYAAVRTLEKIGERRFGRGISYTWVGTPVGLLFQGHSVGRLGAHTGGLNSKVRAVAMVGDYSTNPPTALLINAIGQLIRHEFTNARSQSAILLGGHRDANRRVGRPATACPGDAGQAAITRINEAAVGLPAQPYIPPVIVNRPPDFLPYDFPLPSGHWFGVKHPDRRNHSGYRNDRDQKHIRTLQAALRKRGWSISVDGIYGPQTRGVVVSFQKEKGLAVDGLTGRATWTAIDRSPRT